MSLCFWKKVNQDRLGRLCRRVAALALALSLELPAAAMAYDGMGNPVPAVPGEAPTITIEANAVVDRWYDPKSTVMNVEEYLTGDLEVAVRVQSGKIGEEWQAFDTIGVALKYSPILTPYKFTLINGTDLSGKTDVTAEDKKNAAVEVDLTGTKDFTTMTSMQTLKSKNIATATGHVSGEKGKGGYLFMEVEANRPLVLEEDTVLAVVTFRYDVETYKIVAADAEKWLTPLTTPVAPGGGEATAAEGDPDPGTDPDPGPGADPVCLLQFATRSEMGGRYGKYELEYSSASNDFLYSADPEATDINFMQLDDKDTDLYHGAPTPERVNFRLVNQTTYNDGGLTLDDLATVLFYDWDDTLIGVLIIPRDGDARKLVNDYVRDHMIHPDLREADLTSTARADNYRGKHPSSQPMEDGQTDETSDSRRTDGLVGTDYPLTSKIDYIFLQRPMERVMTTNAAGEEVPTDTWRQISKEDENGEEIADWDEGYPFIYGWALIPDDDMSDVKYTHPKNIWTTLGMGELDAYSGSSSGGYVDLDGAPAELTVAGQEFEFADFNFMKKGHSLKAGSVYAVKAVYEPGEDLLNSLYAYRMVERPYYNKANSNASSRGGAYSVDIAYERTNTNEGGKVRGVARIRDIVVRQDSTSDLLWEDQSLKNATAFEANQSKAKTSYVPIGVDNGDTVRFSLTLSARFNRIDYYVSDKYGSNFVSAQQRMGGNAAMSTQAGEDGYINYVLENYNYFTDDSVTTDIYYDSLAYDEREGSLGYVLNGTLNNIMEVATSRYHDPSDNAIYSNIAYDRMLDANIRDAAGNLPDFNTEGNLQDLIVAAAGEAYRNHYGQTGFWNTEKDCAELTYHQLQHYIINPGRGLLTREAADKETILWCNLHDKCVNERTGKPVDWETFIAAARGQPPYKLEAFTNLEDIELLTHLRKTASGGAFASKEEFISMVQAAVATLPPTGTPTWDQVQAALLGVTLPDVEDRNFWWYDGSTSAPRLTSLGNTVAAAQDAVTPVKMPDGSTMARNDKLNLLRTAFEENAAAATVAGSWNNATKNLCITKGDSEGEKFDTFANFRTAFVDAVTEAEKAGVVLAPGATGVEVREYWQKIQYRILNPGKPFPTEYQSEMDGYWWFDGNSKVADLASMLTAAKRALPVSMGGQNDPAIWNMFTVEDLYAMQDLHFRSNFGGDRYTSANFNAFKGYVQAFVQLSNVVIATSTSSPSQKTNSWNQLQYYLIHAEDPGFDPAAIDAGSYAEQVYYWWRDGKDGEEYALTANVNEGFPTLMEAVFRAEVNKNPKAYARLTADAMAGYRLVSSYTAETTWDDLPKFGTTGDTMDALKAKLAGLYTAATTAGDDYKSLTWRQVQHYLLTDPGVYLAADDPTLPSDDRGDKDGYWWREGNEKPDDGPKKSQMDYFVEEIDKCLAGEISLDELTGAESGENSAFDLYVISGRLGLYAGDDPGSMEPAETSGVDWGNARWNLNDLVTTLMDEGALTAAGIIDWYVLQYYLVSENAYIYGETESYVTPEEARDYYDTVLMGDWAPPEYAAALMAMPKKLMMQQPNTVVETDPDTGITTVTSLVKTELENGMFLQVEVVTTIDPATNLTVTKTTTVLMDADGNELSRSETTDVTETPPEPTESPLPTEPVPPTESPAPTESPEPTESVEPDDPIGPDPEKPGTYTQGKDTAVVDPVDPSPTPDSKEHLVTVPEEVDPPFLSTEEKEETEPEEQGGEELPDAGGTLSTTAWTKQKMCRFVKHIGQRIGREKASGAASSVSCWSGGCGRQVAFQNQRGRKKSGKHRSASGPLCGCVPPCHCVLGCRA